MPWCWVAGSRHQLTLEGGEADPLALLVRERGQGVREIHRWAVDDLLVCQALDPVGLCRAAQGHLYSDFTQ